MINIYRYRIRFLCYGDKGGQRTFSTFEPVKVADVIELDDGLWYFVTATLSRAGRADQLCLSKSGQTPEEARRLATETPIPLRGAKQKDNSRA